MRTCPVWKYLSIISATTFLLAIYALEIAQWAHSIREQANAEEMRVKQQLAAITEAVNKQLPTNASKTLTLNSLSVDRTTVVFKLNQISGTEITGGENAELQKESLEIYCSDTRFLKIIQSLDVISRFEIALNKDNVRMFEFTSSSCAPSNPPVPK